MKYKFRITNTKNGKKLWIGLGPFRVWESGILAGENIELENTLKEIIKDANYKRTTKGEVIKIVNARIL